MSNFTDYAKEELTRAGLFDKDSDYEGMIGKAVSELVDVFSKQGHSGFSASLTIEIFSRVANYKPLTPLSTDPTEWNNVAEWGDGDMWQSRRDSEVFSIDGGKTAYRLHNCKKAQSDCVECKGTGRIHQELKDPSEKP